MVVLFASTRPQTTAPGAAALVAVVVVDLPAVPPCTSSPTCRCSLAACQLPACIPPTVGVTYPSPLMEFPRCLAKVCSSRSLSRLAD